MAVYSKFLQFGPGKITTADLLATGSALATLAVEYHGSTSGTLTLKAAATTSTYSLFWPSAQAAGAGYVLSNDGAGNLSWASPSAADVLDGTFRIDNTSDPTKKIAFDASGIATATTRTIIMPDSNVNLGLVATAIQRDGSVTFTQNQPMGSHKLTGLSAGTTAGDSVRYEQSILISGVNAFAADQSMGGFKLTNLADPVAAQDAVTLNYLSARLNGLTPKASVRVATTVSGTLATAFANGQVIDGITLVTGDRILLKDQSTASQNGIYTVNASGAPTRSTDMDSITPIDEVNGAWVPVREGTANAGKIYVMFSVVTTFPGDALNWEYFNPITSSLAGDMIAYSSGVLSVDLATASGLESTNPGNAAGQLRIKLEASNPSLKFTGSNELAIKFDPAGAILAGASGTAVQVDNSTIEINTNALRVKDAGITLAKLASNSVDENKIVSTALSATGALTGGSGSKLAWNPDGTSLEISANAARIKTTAYDQVTITGGSGSAAAVQRAPALIRTLVAGESFAANTSFAVRWGVTANGETAQRVYKADPDTTSFDLFYVIGMASSGTSVTAGQNIIVTSIGSFTLGTSDTAFASNSDGKAVFLTSGGAFSTTAPVTAGSAITRIGIVQFRSATANLNIIDVHPSPVGVN